MILGYKCTLCDEFYELGASHMTCPSCGEKGILDVIYDYEGIKKVFNKAILADRTEYSIWRYKELLPVEETHLSKTLAVGWTPLYESVNLRDCLGLSRLYIKDEGMNPTASLKDRASVIAVVKAIEVGKDTICCSSTGNAASSLAGNAAKLGLKTVIFVPKRAPIGKLTQLLIYGATVISVEGDYKETFDLSKAAIDHFGYYNRNAAINPFLVEGKKTVALEIAEQLDFEVTDWVCVSVGDGCTIGSVYKGFYDLYQLGMISKIPKILGIQAEGCAPIYRAFKNNRPLEPEAENTLADSIAVGIPRNPIKALRAVKLSHGDYMAVSDEAILEAMSLLGKTEGIFSEPAGATGLAGLIEALKMGVISHDESVTIISTGNGLKDIDGGRKAAGEPISLTPEIQPMIDLLSEEKG